MRILQIGPLPFEVGGLKRGGVATHVWGLAKHLASRGHQLAVLAYNYSPEEGWPIIRENVAIYGIKQEIKASQKLKILNPILWSKIMLTKRHFGTLLTFREVIKNLLLYRQVIKNFKPEIIHVHHLETRFPFAFFSTNGSIPIVTTVHSTHFIEFSDFSRKKEISNLIQNNLILADNLVFVSRFVEHRYELLFPGKLSGCRTYVIHNPMDSSLYFSIPKEASRKILGKELDKQYILFVGSLIPRKGAHILIQAASILRNKGLDFRIMVVGDGYQKGELLRLIKNEDLESIVSLEGAKDCSQLLNYYNAADLFVLPSASEGFSLVYLEAMLCGCPVIGTKGVADESIPSTEFGYLVPPNDAYALAELIEKGLKREWDKESIVSHARLFEWNERITDFEDVYRNITQKGKQSHG